MLDASAESLDRMRTVGDPGVDKLIAEHVATHGPESLDRLLGKLFRSPRMPEDDPLVQRYLAALPPAIAGSHGDLHTFRVCCRLVRGFALDDADALMLLQEWNTRCLPPWTDRELEQKITSARRYGRESIGGLLEARR